MTKRNLRPIFVSFINKADLREKRRAKQKELALLAAKIKAEAQSSFSGTFPSK